MLAATVLGLALMSTPALAHWDDDDNDGLGPNKIEGNCPGPIFKTTKLIGNIIWRAGDPIPCITLAAKGIKLDLDGFFVSVAANSGIRAIAIEKLPSAIENVSNVRVEGGGGFVVTAYPADVVPLMPSEICSDETGAPCAIHAKNSSNVHIREVRVRNLIPGASFTPEMTPDGAEFLIGNGTPPICAQNGARGGAGIVLKDVYGAKISDNLIQCYNNGIVLENTNGNGSDDHLAHNLLMDNANAADPLALPVPLAAGNSVGIFFINASGWLVKRNVLTGNGSDPVSAANSNIVLAGTSTRNRFQQNTWDNNVGPGVQVNAPLATKNTFYRNKVAWNSGGLPNGGPPAYAGGFDVGDSNPLFANRYQRNRCRWQAGPGIPPGHCDPTIN